MAKTLPILLVLSATFYLVQSAPIETIKLKFKISARDLPDKDDIGDSDPYAEIFFTEENKKDEVKIGKTSVLTDNGNPDWGEIFEFEFVRSKRQRFILRLYDEDNLREDDNLGQAYIEVADFVDKSGHITANLPKKGYVILESLIPLTTPALIQSTTVTPPKPPPFPTTPIKSATVSPILSANVPMKLQFKLSARNLLNKDKTGFSDPFAEILFTEGGSSKQKNLGKTAVIEDSSNPVWKEVFEFQYDPSKNQKFLIEVRDSDSGGDSDGLGEVWIDVADYVKKGQRSTVNLDKQGTLTIETALQPTPATTTYKPPSNLVKITNATTTPSPIRKLKFRLYVRNLEDKDLLGTSDPYVKVYYQQGSDTEIFLGNTQKFQDKEDADFPDVYEISYNSAVKSKLRLLVLDEDDNRKDEELGNVSCDIGDYLKSNENLTINLPKQGSITVLKAA